VRLTLRAQRAAERAFSDFVPQAVHIATEGPLGWAARRLLQRRRWPFTTSFHTRFAEYIALRTRIPLRVGYAWLKWFHRPASAILASTLSLKRELEERRFGNVQLWSRGVDTHRFSPGPRVLLKTERPVFMYVGRVAVEKNVEAFLKLSLPGSKWVVGDGPLLGTLRAGYPEAHFAGPQSELLPAYYRAADVLVFPSKTDTFGLVMLEAMACGTPVAAYPVQGPLDVLGGSAAAALNEDLGAACLEALTIPRERVRAHAQLFSWRRATEQFLGSLTPIG
jgi:glycosyltransferase involved in cell wall biosynthesis